MYIYIYIQRERERQREREKQLGYSTNAHYQTVDLHQIIHVYENTVKQPTSNAYVWSLGGHPLVGQSWCRCRWACVSSDFDSGGQAVCFLGNVVSF